MKNINQLKQEREELYLIRKKKAEDREKGELRAALVKVKIINLAILYLETNPSEDFIKHEIKRIDKLVKSVDDRFFIHHADSKFGTLNLENAAKKSFRKEYGIPNMKTQLKMLKFLHS